MAQAWQLTDTERARALAYFDPAWYGATYELDGLDARELETHFLEDGIWQGHNPGPWFDSDIYTLTSDGSIKRTGVPAFAHYIRWGCLERRRPNPLFQPAVYAYFLGADAAAIPDLYAHFIRAVARGGTPRFNPIIPAGWTNMIPDIPSRDAYARLFDAGKSLVGLLPRCCFRPVFYRRVAKSMEWENELFDYLLTGWREGYDPHPLFDGGFYVELLEKHESFSHNVFESQTPLEHFIANWSEAPAPSPFFDAPYYNHIADLKNTEYAHPLEAFCALDGNLRGLSPHRQVNFEALGHAWNNSVLEENKGFDANNFIALVTALRLGEGVPTVEASPELSILTLNYHKPGHTILSVYCALRNLGSRPAEVLVLDNGSGNWDLHQIERYLMPFPAVSVTGSETNLFFGEGNNLLIDRARGKYLLFLNNDAYLGPNTISDLMTVLDSTPDCALVGPTLLFPDGTIQEEGGTAPDCGNSLQRSKHLPAHEFILRRPPSESTSEVDYVSAAVAMVRAEIINTIGGFDLIFEPLFFEDTDLCRRMRAHGHKVLVSHRSFAVHLENTSTSEYLAERFIDQINSNRQRYADRWLRPASQDIPRTDANISRFKPTQGAKPKAVVYTPFRLSVGGGERYILSVAACLTVSHDVTLVTQHQTSRTRLAFVMQDLGLDGSFGLLTLDELGHGHDIDLCIAMGNEILPTIPAMARRNIYHLQFPFPLHRVEGRSTHALDGYDCIVVNSDFTANHTRQALAERRLKDLPVHVVHPPVRVNRDEALALARFSTPHPLTVATVGRYITREHMKRQDVVVDTLAFFTKHYEKCAGTVSGSLSSDPDDIAYFNKLRQDAPRGVVVECNVSRDRVVRNMVEADLYMHATGFGISPAIEPHYMEHFGISIVEAMSYGCVPLVYDGGGAAELVHAAGVGYRIRSVEAAVDAMLVYNALDVEAKQALSRKAFAAAQTYNEATFRTAWLKLAV